eukprot:4561136-Pyramimonas_sp.AAC.1
MSMKQPVLSIVHPSSVRSSCTSRCGRRNELHIQQIHTRHFARLRPATSSSSRLRTVSAMRQYKPGERLLPRHKDDSGCRDDEFVPGHKRTGLNDESGLMERLKATPFVAQAFVSAFVFGAFCVRRLHCTERCH